MGDNNSAIDPASVNWAQYGPGNFPFQIRQKPGPRNALGTGERQAQPMSR